MNKKKQSKSLFTCPEAKHMWEMSDDAVLEIIPFGDLYPHLFMPEEVARIPVETVLFQIFRDKDREVALEWLRKNIANID